MLECLRRCERQLAGEDEESDEEHRLAHGGASRPEDLHGRRDKDLALQGGLDEAIVVHQQFLHAVIFIRVIQPCDERQVLNEMKHETIKREVE